MVNMSRKQLASLVKKNKANKLKKKAQQAKQGPLKNRGMKSASSSNTRSVHSPAQRGTADEATIQHISSSSSSSKLSEMQQKFKDKLDGARFRALNEKLYTQRSQDAFIEFQSDPKMFQVYHEGYKKQVESWPENPLDNIIRWVKSVDSCLVVADMGCGDARLAASVPNKVHSFDLVSVNSAVTACDIASVPLEDESVDIVVFCLSLMGTNIGDFLKEAHRILRPSGVMKIAEVKSRFFESGKDGVKVFTRTIKKAGFDINERVSPNKMFFVLDCRKSGRESFIDDSFSAKPCVYKKR